MKFFKYFGYVVVFVYLGGLLWLWYLPGEYQVSRSVEVEAPPSLAFAHVANLEKWEHWSPWEQLDIEKKKLYEGVPGSVGYTYYWRGNDDIGEGSIEIVRILPNQQIEFLLKFKKPYESQSRNFWTFEQQGSMTHITWTDSGNLPFFLRMISKRLEHKIGASFEYGLTNIKALAERDFKNQQATIQVGDSTFARP